MGCLHTSLDWTRLIMLKIGLPLVRLFLVKLLFDYMYM